MSRRHEKSEGRSGWYRSGLVTISLLVVVVLGLALGWREHIEGQFGRLKRELNGPAAAPVVAPVQPGGQDPIVLERSTIEGGSAPELLSATFLPGRGMNLLQIKAFIPGRGEVQLLASPSLTDVPGILNGKDSDASGFQSLAVGAPLELPWSGDIYGQYVGDVLNTSWNGNSIRLPILRRGNVTAASGGLLLLAASSAMKMNVMPDGGETNATYDAADFSGRWPSKTQVTTSAQLSGHLLEMAVTARNSGDGPEPMGIGWSPRFAILDGKRENLVLRVPSTTRLERNPRNGEPTGKLLQVANTRYDFSGRNGQPLGNVGLEDTFVNLRQAPLDNGPVVELRDPKNNYGLRITVLSPSIKAIHVSAPANAGYIALSPRFNYDDPFGREWGRDVDTGMAILKPGQTAQWRIRLEIFSLSGSS